MKQFLTGQQFYKNEYLFSEIYLEKITNFDEKPEIINSLKTLKEYKDYADVSSFNNWKSSLIQKVFGVLGFSYTSFNENLLLLFVQGKTDKPISVCYTLLPSEDLDNTTIGKHWSEKIIRNLRHNNLQWGLLTNGNKWRIYHLDEPTPYESYLEIDLELILEKEDTKNYMIFYEFMKVDNFILDGKGKCKFDEFKQESYEQIEYIEEELKDALKQQEGEEGKGVLNDLCMGYVDFIRSKVNKEFKDEVLLKEIYSGAMLYMFRLLFVFYASARNLLTDKEINSLAKILKKSVNLYHSNNSNKLNYNLWEDLREVFGIIDIQYNGGLFDPQENKFIESNRVSDYYLCRVLYNMNFYENDIGIESTISFRDMGVRHLGTLYEGLLEHKLFIAEENTQVKFEKGIIKFIPESEGGVIIEGSYVPKGEVYFAGDKGERKSTGSYYTPEYIVDYIVNNTVGKKLRELKEEFIKETAGLLQDIKAAPDKAERKALTDDFRDRLLTFVSKKILKLSVLDPAMGSGHFLVNSSNKISNFITEFLNDYDFVFSDTSSTTYWRRRVVENCIYGVDINPLAVELAKLSLWILSMAKDAHLSFLNHHLKCGNSLIGARLSDIGIYPGNKKPGKATQISIWDKDVKFKETVEKVIADYLAIEGRETVSKDDIEFKKELLDEINEALKPYKKVCDFHTSIYFDNNVDEVEYFIKIKKTETIKAGSNNFFHWELEFPEIFRNSGGFDIIVGNPPYIRHQNINQYIKKYLWSQYNSGFDRSDIYAIFIEKALSILKSNGDFSMIVSDTWRNNSSFLPLRKIILNNNEIQQLAKPITNPFDAAVNTIILIIKRKIFDKISEINIYDIDESNKTLLNSIKRESLAPDNLEISLDQTNIESKILKVIELNSIPFGEISDNQQGIHFGKRQDEFTSDQPFNTKFNKKAVKGINIRKYYCDGFFYVNYDLKEILTKNPTARPKDEPFCEVNHKILVRRIGGGELIAAYDDKKLYCLNTIQVCRIINNAYHPYYILSLLNSKVYNFYFKKKYGNSDVSISKLNALPIKSISKAENSSEVIIMLVELYFNTFNNKTLSLQILKIIELVIYELFFSDNYYYTKILWSNKILLQTNSNDQIQLFLEDLNTKYISNNNEYITLINTYID